MHNSDSARESRHRGGDFLAGMICGAAAGAAVGLLMAAKPGAELRGQIVDSADRLRRRMNENYNKAADTVTDAVDKGREAFRHGRETFDEVRAQYGTETGPTVPSPNVY
jgi:gas vesicle protein